MSASGNYITEDLIDNWPAENDADATFETTDVAITTDILTVGLDIPTGSELRFTSTGTLPSPLAYSTVYYAVNASSTTLKVATTAANAAAGTIIDITDVGTGSHTLYVGEGFTTADKQAVIDRAEDLIERVCEDYFYEKDFDVYIDGNGKDRIAYGGTANILSVTSVELSGVSLPSGYYTFNGRFIYKDPGSTIGDDLAELHYLMGQSLLFPKGVGNIHITGTCGHSSTPDAIIKAAIILCRAENDSSLYQRYGIFDEEDIGNGDYRFVKRKRIMTGIVEADMLLYQYAKQKPRFGAV